VVLEPHHFQGEEQTAGASIDRARLKDRFHIVLVGGRKKRARPKTRIFNKMFGGSEKKPDQMTAEDHTKLGYEHWKIEEKLSLLRLLSSLDVFGEDLLPVDLDHHQYDHNEKRCGDYNGQPSSLAEEILDERDRQSTAHRDDKAH